AVLAAACLTDWLADRYLGSETWRKARKASWVFAPAPAARAEERWFTEHLRLHYGLHLPPPQVVDDTPRWLRVGMTGGQVLLALVRPRPARTRDRPRQAAAADGRGNPAHDSPEERVAGRLADRGGDRGPLPRDPGVRQHNDRPAPRRTRRPAGGVLRPEVRPR